MRLRQCAALLLILCAPRAATGQAPPPSLQDAKRAFAPALANHDRAGFVAMLAPDADSTLPTAVRGPQAIANSWSPFLVDRRAETGGGTGPYRFGMTRKEVTGVADCAPYTAVAVTGGLECPHYRFDGREMNISFLFAGDALRRIQLWYYEGESRADAQEAVAGILAFFKRTTGGATITDRPELAVSAEGVIGAIDRGPTPRPGEIVHVEICGPTNSGSERWFARVGRHRHGYMVMLFADPAAAR